MNSVTFSELILSRLHYILTRATAIFNYGKLLWRLPWLSFARETFCTSSSPDDGSIQNYSCRARKKVNFLIKMQKKSEQNISKLVAKFGGSANLWREIYWICIISMPRCAVIFGKLSSFFSNLLFASMHYRIVVIMVTAGPKQGLKIRGCQYYLVGIICQHLGGPWHPRHP